MADLVQGFIKRYDAAKSNADNWRDIFDSAYEYAIPNRNTFETLTPGARKNDQVFDTTAVAATNNFVSKIQNALVTPGMQWATLIGGNQLPIEERQQISQQLELVNDIIFQYIQTSNFDMAVNESFLDLAIGTGVLQIHEGTDDDPLKFVAVPLEQIYPEEGPHGSIETVWRNFQDVPGRNVDLLWPDANMSKRLRQRIDDKPSMTFDFIEGTVFEPSEETDKPDMYRYIVIEQSTKELIVDRTSPSSIWVVYRWSKSPGEIFGRGPVINALPTILSLNKMIEFELKAAQLAITPPWMAFRSGALNPYTFQIMPNTIIPVEPVGPANDWPIKPLETGMKPEFGQLLANDLRAQIERLLLASPIGEPQGPVRTATEVSLLRQNLLEEAGPSMGRLQVELVSRIIDRVLFILRKKGLLPDLSVNGREITLKYESPLVSNQGKQDVQKFSQFFGELQAIYGQEIALMLLEPAKVPFWLGERFNTNLELIKSEADILAVLQKVQQAQQPALPQQPREAPVLETPQQQVPQQL